MRIVSSFTLYIHHLSLSPLSRGDVRRSSTRGSGWRPPMDGVEGSLLVCRHLQRVFRSSLDTVHAPRNARPSPVLPTQINPLLPTSIWNSTDCCIGPQVSSTVLAKAVPQLASRSISEKNMFAGPSEAK